MWPAFGDLFKLALLIVFKLQAQSVEVSFSFWRGVKHFLPLWRVTINCIFFAMALIEDTHQLLIVSFVLASGHDLVILWWVHRPATTKGNELSSQTNRTIAENSMCFFEIPAFFPAGSIWHVFLEQFKVWPIPQQRVQNGAAAYSTAMQPRVPRWFHHLGQQSAPAHEVWNHVGLYGWSLTKLTCITAL